MQFSPLISPRYMTLGCFKQVNRVSAHFTCSSVLSALVFDGIFYFIRSFWLFLTKNCSPKKSINLKQLNHKWNELRHDSHGYLSNSWNSGCKLNCRITNSDCKDSAKIIWIVQDHENKNASFENDFNHCATLCVQTTNP